MAERNMRIGERSRDVLTYMVAAYKETIEDSGRNHRLLELGRLVDDLVNLIYGYTSIEDTSLDATDEIINWTVPDVEDDLDSAICALAAGCYKAAAALMRNALDIGFCSLYFQVRQNEGGVSGLNEAFSKWDRGDADTPNLGTTLPVVGKLATIKEFDQQNNCSVLLEVKEHFHYLCCFTHSRPFNAKDGSASNAMNLNSACSPEFDAVLFDRFEALFRATVAWICIPWVVGYPQLLRTRPLGVDQERYRRILVGKRGGDALKFGWNQKSQ